jgi:hypothetical protein
LTDLATDLAAAIYVGKKKISAQIPDDTDESYAKFASKIKHIAGDRMVRTRQVKWRDLYCGPDLSAQHVQAKLMTLSHAVAAPFLSGL